MKYDNKTGGKKRSTGNKFDNRRSDSKASEGRKSDDRTSGARSYDGRVTNDNRKSDDRTNGSRRYDGRASDDNRKSDDRTNGGRRYDGRVSDDNRRFEGRKSDDRRFDDKVTGGRKFDNRKPDNRNFKGKDVSEKRYTNDNKKFREVEEVKSTRAPRRNGAKPDYLVEEPFEIDENLLFGRNAVMEALKGNREIDKILVQKGEKEGSVIKIISSAKAKSIVLLEVEKSKLDELTGREKHQGVVAYAAAHEYVSVDEILEAAKEKGEEPFVLILDNIQDPHNLGAIIRSAHNAGVHGIIIPKRRAVGLTGTVAKASAGALEYMKVAKVSNIIQTLRELKEKGLWIACADMDGKTLYEEQLTGPIGIVIGSEGEGISKLTRDNCDYIVSVPMYGKVTSLNASVAASLMVYEVVRQRNFSGR